MEQNKEKIKMENPDCETRLWTTTKDTPNTIGYFVFHKFGQQDGFYDWWATLSAQEQINTRDRVVAIIRSVMHTDEK